MFPDAGREKLDVPGSAGIDLRLLVEEEERKVTAKPDMRATPPSALLGRLGTFLPQLKASNEALFASGATPGFEDSEGGVVQLDLACGVFDLESREAVEAARRATGGEAAELSHAEALEGAEIEAFGTDLSEDEDEEGDEGVDMREVKTTRKRERE